MLNIRQAVRSDVDRIIEIESICFPKAEAADAAEIRRRFAAFPENFFVAEKENEVIGFILGCTTDTPELPDELYHNTALHKPDGAYQTVFGLDVLPEYRGAGVASELMRRLIAVSRERGRKGIVLTCKDHLIGFYEQFGYEHRGVSASEHGGAKWNDMVVTF